MNEKFIKKELMEIDACLQETKQEIKGAKSPLWYIIAAVLALLVVLMIFPYYSIKLDPWPKHIPTISEVVPINIEIEKLNNTINSRRDFLLFLTPSDPVIKQTADKIISLSGCGSNKICQAKAIYFFVRDNFDYVSDPASFEYVKSAKESLVTHNGDCDDASVLLVNLLEAIGIKARFVFIPEHVYVQAYLSEALKKYQVDGWVDLDPACKNCDFGEIPWENRDEDKTYVGYNEKS